MENAMTVYDDLEGALMSWATDASAASAVTETIFTSVIAALRRRFPDAGRAELELLLADARRDADDMLDSMITGTVPIDTAVDIIIKRFIGDEP
jgi:hypothetical protein